MFAQEPRPPVDTSTGIIAELKQAEIQPLSHPYDTLLSAHCNYEDECERGQMDTQALCAHVPKGTAMTLECSQI